MTTPSCPACGAKFSHDASLKKCKRCGLPDLILNEGPHMVARWKAGRVKQVQQQPEVEFARAQGGNKSRRPNKHGRKGAKNMKKVHVRRYRRAASD